MISWPRNFTDEDRQQIAEAIVRDAEYVMATTPLLESQKAKVAMMHEGAPARMVAKFLSKQLLK